MINWIINMFRIKSPQEVMIAKLLEQRKYLQEWSNQYCAEDAIRTQQMLKEFDDNYKDVIKAFIENKPLN